MGVSVHAPTMAGRRPVLDLEQDRGRPRSRSGPGDPGRSDPRAKAQDVGAGDAPRRRDPVGSGAAVGPTLGAHARNAQELAVEVRLGAEAQFQHDGRHRLSHIGKAPSRRMRPVSSVARRAAAASAGTCHGTPFGSPAPGARRTRKPRDGGASARHSRRRPGVVPAGAGRD